MRLTGTPFAATWGLACWLAAHAVGGILSAGHRGASVYVRGGFADLTPGLSDVDLAIVVPGDPAAPGAARARIERRWERLIGALPAVGALVDWPRIHETPELARLAGASAFTYGLGAEGGESANRAVYLGAGASLDTLRHAGRPGLYGATADWRLLRGPDRRPPEPDRGRQLRRIAAWLELVYWWKPIFRACVDRASPRAADVAVKAIAEPARIWLWLAHGERPADREAVLERALRLLPEEEPALRLALRLRRHLRRSPDAPLDDALGAAVRFSERIAELVGREIAGAGADEVRLLGEAEDAVSPGEPDRSRRLIPLADWRAVAYPSAPDETLEPDEGEPSAPDVIARAAKRRAGPYAVLTGRGLMLLPGEDFARTRLRTIQCSATDPVSFALLAGDRTARFPSVPGWSASDWARRAVNEHRAWLLEPGVAGATYDAFTRGPAAPARAGSPEAAARSLGFLLTAVRAALFLDSVESGEPALCLTIAETVRRLSERRPEARGAGEDALTAYREFARGGSRPPEPVLDAMRAAVSSLPAYST